MWTDRHVPLSPHGFRHRGDVGMGRHDTYDPLDHIVPSCCWILFVCLFGETVTQQNRFVENTSLCPHWKANSLKTNSGRHVRSAALHCFGPEEVELNHIAVCAALFFSVQQRSCPGEVGGLLGSLPLKPVAQEAGGRCPRHQDDRGDQTLSTQCSLSSSLNIYSHQNDQGPRPPSLRRGGVLSYFP